MKLSVKGVMKEESQLDISFNKLELTFNEPQIGIDVVCKLNHERGKPIDNVNEYAVIEAQKIIDSMGIVVNDDGVQKNITKYQLANLATKIVFWAIQEVTNKWKTPIVGYVSTEKDKLKSWKQSMADTKKEIESIQEKTESLKKERDIEEEVNKRVAAIVWERQMLPTSWVTQGASSLPTTLPTNQGESPAPTSKVKESRTIDFMWKKLTVHPM